MAKTANNGRVVLLNMVLVLSFLLIIALAESRSFLGKSFTGSKGKPQCDSVYGVESGDNCFEVTQMFNLTTEYFNSINPNVNCTGLFIGQWLCVDGTAN